MRKILFAVISLLLSHDLLAADAVIAGNGFSFYLSGSTLKAWGANDTGQLGDTTTIDRHTPVNVEQSQMGGVKNVSAGAGHSLAISQDGYLWSWGENYLGECGLGNTYAYVNSPAQVSTSVFPSNSIASIAAGGDFSLAAKTDGTVYSWGGNTYGELGRGTPGPLQSDASPSPGSISGLSSITQVAAGSFHGLALKSDGTVWSWGYNYTGQLGDGTTTTRESVAQIAGLFNVTSIRAAGDMSLALKGDGTVWQWGTHGKQVGVPETPAVTTPTQVAGLSNITFISAGYTHNIAVDGNGNLYTWGYNVFGELGDGSTTDSTTPLLVKTGVTSASAGGDFTLSLDADGIYGWGSNRKQQLALPSSSTTELHSPTEIVYLTTPPNPVNDNFVNRIILTGANSYASNTLAGATWESGEPTHVIGYKSTWWSWTAPDTGVLSFYASSVVPVGIDIYTGSAIDNLTLVSNAADGSLSVPVVTGQQYQIATSSNYDGALYITWDLNSSINADLGLNANHPAQIYSDGEIHYYIWVDNAGPQTATGVTVSITDFDSLNTTFVSSESPGCSLSGNTISCAVGDISAFASSSPVNIYLSPTHAPQTISNTIAVTSGLTDPYTANNQKQYSTDVLAETTPVVDTQTVPLPQWAIATMGLLMLVIAVSTLRRRTSI